MKKLSLLTSLFCLFLVLTSQAVERVYLNGTSVDMGQQWGEKQKNVISALKGQFNGMALLYLKDDFNQLKKKSLKIAEHMSKEDLDELKGIAKAVNAPYEEILTFNLFYTHCVTNLGCRQFASWGDQTENGELIHARNLDWIDYPGSPMKKFNTVVNYKGKEQVEYLLLTWPGFTSALTGTNKEGITIAFNQLPHKGDRTHISEPTFYTIKRSLRTARTLEEVIKIFKDTKPMDSGSIMVSDAKRKKAAVIEVIRGKVGVRYPKSNMIGNANHATAEAGIANGVKTGNADYPVCTAAKTISGKLSVKNVQNLMMHSNVLQPKLNILSVTFKYSENRMWLSCGKTSAAKGPFVELKLFSNDE